MMCALSALCGPTLTRFQMWPRCHEGPDGLWALIFLVGLSCPCWEIFFYDSDEHVQKVKVPWSEPMSVCIVPLKR